MSYQTPFDTATPAHAYPPHPKWADMLFIAFISVFVIGLSAMMSTIFVLGAIGLGMYLAVRAWRRPNCTSVDRVLLAAALVLGANAGLTTFWYGMIGNIADRELAPLWSQFNCTYGGDGVNCGGGDSLLERRDALLKQRHVTRTIFWEARGDTDDDGPYVSVNTYGLAIWWPI